MNTNELTYKITLLLILIIFIIRFFLIRNYLLSEYSKNLNLNLIYECGFDSIFWYHNKISLHFFKIGLIFILFDLELIFLVFLYKNIFFYIRLIILLFILITLVLEIYYKSLNWNY